MRRLRLKRLTIVCSLTANWGKIQKSSLKALLFHGASSNFTLEYPFFSLHKLLICRLLHTPSNLSFIKSLVLDYPTIGNTDSFLWCRILMDLNVLCESSSSGCNWIRMENLSHSRASLALRIGLKGKFKVNWYSRREGKLSLRVYPIKSLTQCNPN